ncbi:MAG TPA: S8 family serine peptidase [Gemmatimonadaceae bacterium]|jgi:subtilisin family serine protease
MTFRSVFAGGLAAAVLLAGCKDQSPISHAPNHLVIVSGANQSEDPSTPLDSALVVQVLDGAEKPVSGVSLTWTVTGGGTVSAPTSTTDANGQATVTWTLGSSTGTQVVTVTSPQITGASVSFVAGNGATITGSITPATGLPFGASFSRATSSTPRLSIAASTSSGRRLTTNRIVVGFKSQMLGVAAAGAASYRSLSAARAATSLIQQRTAAFANTLPVSHAEISPAILAARLRVDDPSQIDAVIAKLQADPNVAWVERDAIISIHDGAPSPVPNGVAQLFGAIGALPASAGPAGAPPTTHSVATKLPNDPLLISQYWPTSMVDLPHAWAITTGSANVTVAVVDMGIRFDHPDIAANLTKDGYDFVSQIPYEITAQDDTVPQVRCEGGAFNTIDGDGNGPDADPTDPDDVEFSANLNCWSENPLGDHGLWTAGIIGAVGNDADGAVGVNWTVHIRPVRVLGITGEGSNFDIAQGVLYAAGLPASGANGALVQTSTAQIINMSLGGPYVDNSLQSAVAAAINAGSLIVASAGNDGLDFADYPAGYSGVMAVSAVGQDGTLASYSNAGQLLSVAAPGGDFRFDDNGGGGVAGPGWNFAEQAPTYLFGYGTSAAAPYVSGVAALLLAQTPGLTAAQLRSRIEQYATRPSGVTRSDMYGWGIVDAYNSLTQTNGPTRQTLVKLVNSSTGVVARTTTASNGTFAFTRLAQGSYYVEAGTDENADSTIGVPGRPFGLAGGFGAPTVFSVNGNAQSTLISLGTPTEVEPNDDNAHANVLSVGGYVDGNITPPDVNDVYSVTIPLAGQYTFETSGVVGSCGFGIELDTRISVVSAAGVSAGSSDDFTSTTGVFCSRVTATLTAGVYYVTVTPSPSARFKSFVADHGRYRLAVRAGS